RSTSPPRTTLRFWHRTCDACSSLHGGIVYPRPHGHESCPLVLRACGACPFRPASRSTRHSTAGAPSTRLPTSGLAESQRAVAIPARRRRRRRGQGLVPDGAARCSNDRRAVPLGKPALG